MGDGGRVWKLLSGSNCSTAASRCFLPVMKDQQRQCESGGGGKNRREKGKSPRPERLHVLAMDAGDRGICNRGGSSSAGGEGTGEIGILSGQSIQGP